MPPIRASWSGAVYNLGNAALMAGALLGISAGGAQSLFAPLAAIASILLFVAGIYYARSNFIGGNFLTGFGSLFLAGHLVLSGIYLSAILVLLFQAVPKFVAAKPVWARRYVPNPDKVAGYAPMITRVPLLVEAAKIGDVCMVVAATLWLFGDFCLTRPLIKKLVTA